MAAAAIARATFATRVITLVMSAVANSSAMAHTAEGLVVPAAYVFVGRAIPDSIAFATYTLGRAIRT